MQKIFSFCCCGRKENDAKEDFLFVLTPADEQDQDNDAEAGEESSTTVRMMRKTLDEIKQINNFLGKKVMKTIIENRNDTSTRLDSIEKSGYETRSSIQRDTIQKFADMKDYVKGQQKALEKTISETNAKSTDMVSIERTLKDMRVENGVLMKLQ